MTWQRSNGINGFPGTTWLDTIATGQIVTRFLLAKTWLAIMKTAKFTA
jgi:hypothetical protein